MGDRAIEPWGRLYRGDGAVRDHCCMGGVAHPTGTVTFLFTDVESHTRLWNTMPAEMSGALARHDELVSDVIERHRGYVFKTAGDSFAAAFASAGAAVDAAVELQDALRAEPWPGGLELRVRMGLHTGVASLRDGDYFGPDVICAARVEASGHGGQVLLSAATAGLVDLPDLVSLGDHILAGFDRPLELHQIGAEQFPPLRSLTPHTHNLGARVPHLIGRGAEVERLVACSMDERVVMITGPGGIGKTSLALTVAHRLAQLSGSEVWWCDLVTAGGGDVALRAGEAAGLRSGASEPGEVVRSLRHRGATWLVLDNCEHVVDEVARLVEELVDAESVRVVATSRLPLDVAGEVVVAIGPLPADDAAVDLFAERASLDTADGLTASDRSAIARICRRVDGIPLAVELVAAHARTFSLSDIERRIDRLLEATSARRHDERHRTMASAIEWSVELLEDSRADALGELAVFPSGFDLDAAEAILGPSIDAEPMLVLEDLVRHSLVQIDRPEQGAAARSTRYRLLVPVREYATQRLWRDPDRTRDCHLEHYLDRLEDAHRALAMTSCDPILTLLDADLDNLNAVHDWALQSGRIDDDLRLYRPLMIADAHEYFEVGEWALETLEIDTVKSHDRWRDALAKGFQTATFHTADDYPSDLFESLRAAGAGSRSDLIEGQIAWIECAHDRLHAEGVARWDAIETDDPFVIYLRFLTSSISRGVLDGDRRTIARAEFERGLAWARSIGARNLEAAIATQLALAELIFGGDVQEAHDLADHAAGLTAAVRMHHLHWMAVGYRVHAAVLGADSPHDVLADAVSVLRSALSSSVGARLPTALNGAAAILHRAGDNAAAAVAIAGNQELYFGRRFATQLIPQEDLEAARARLAGDQPSPWDVATETLTALERLLADRNTSRYPAI